MSKLFCFWYTIYMKKVIVGSTNPVKLETTKEAFQKSFPVEEFEFITYSALSGVPDQPIGQTETKQGATNRAEACKLEYPDADYYVGLEGGLEKIEGEYWVFAWMCILSNSNAKGFGRTGSFLLPPRVSKLIDQGEELGTATDITFNETNSKHKGGTIGVLTNENITRKDFYKDALIFALIPFVKPELY
jgi:inosine/xanthosine triphosphatase